MARGGCRPGSGRKRKTVDGAKPVAEDIRKSARAAKLTPLEYMLTVMNDEEADAARRDRMAQAAAPFCHPRKESVGQGKREAREDDAKEAATGKFATPPAPKLVVNNT